MANSGQPYRIDVGDLPLSIPVAHAGPAYRQLAAELQALMESRSLRAGTRLPATRALADALGINRNTVVAAFERLTSLGLIETRGRGGSIVSELPVHASSSAATAANSTSLAVPRAVRPIDFTLGWADPSPLPVEVWRRACREAGRHLPGAGYGDPQGDIELRRQIALYLGRSRGMRVDPAHIVITAGAGQAIERIAEVVLSPRAKAAIEEPGYSRAARSFLRFGARLAPIPVDGDGIDTQSLFVHKRPPRVLHLTPSHQYPLGARLSSARRHALIRWARSHDVLLIENDYDGEFRYGSPPLPTLASMAGFDHIAYVGTFSKVLSPAIRLGFIVARSGLIQAIARTIADTQDTVSVVTQQIVRSLIQAGELERHIRRTRRSYAARRATMLRALADIPEIHSVSGHAAGLHVVVQLRKGISDHGLVDRLENQGVVVDRVADYRLHSQPDGRILLAYGHLTEAEIVAGIQRFRVAVRAARLCRKKREPERPTTR